MAHIIQTILLWAESSKYILLFCGAFAEGPVVMIAGGFLLRLGQVNFLLLYLALVFGDFSSDVGWYLLGRFGSRQAIFKYGKFLGLTPEILDKMEKRFIAYHEKILLITKLTMGMGFGAILLIISGIFKVPFKKWTTLVLGGGFIWTAFLIAIGYFFGNVYTLISGPLKIIFAGVVLVLIICAIKYGSDYLKTKEI